MRQPAWDGWSEDGSWQGSRDLCLEEDLQSNENWSWKPGRDLDQQSTENWSWANDAAEDDGELELEDGIHRQRGQQRPWQKAVAGRGERSAYYAGSLSMTSPTTRTSPRRIRSRPEG